MSNITFSGCNPEYTKHCTKILKENYNDIIEATLPFEDIKDTLDKFSNLNLSMKIEGVGRISNYTRPGSEWETRKTNIYNYKRYFTSNNYHIDISPNVNILTINGIHRLAKFCDTIGMTFKLNFSKNPEHLCISNLSQNSRDVIIKNISTIDVSTDIHKELYKIIKFFSENSPTQQDIPVWRHILRDDTEHNNKYQVLRTFSKVDPIWWDTLVSEE